MIAPTYIRKPENWQDFEKLCKKLWGEIWNCSTSIKRNGRSGQTQNGVDIYGLPVGEIEYFGIQCKGKDDYSKQKLTKKEIDDEISKALNFLPKLKTYIFATTADKDEEIEQYIREKNIEHIKKGLFFVDVFSWNDIVDLLEEQKRTYNWYVNNCQYKDATDIDVSIKGNKEFEIYPQYIRTTKIYIKKPNLDLFRDPTYAFRQQLLRQTVINPDLLSISHFPWKQKSKVDYRWCTIPITIRNIGSTVIEDYKLYLIFDPQKIEDIDDKYRSYNPGPLFDQSAIVTKNIEKEKRREVFESSEHSNVIEFRPLNSILVQDEHRTFKIGVKPKDDIAEIQIQWVIKSRDYQKKGEMLLIVTPQYEDKTEHIESDIPKEKETIIIPKIVEE